MPARNRHQRGFRTLLALAGPLYLSWWFTVEWLLPGSYNPLFSRLLVCAVPLTLFVLTLAKPALMAQANLLFTASMSLVTLHYFYLAHRNQLGHEWIIGTFIVISAVCAAVYSEIELMIYAGLVIVLTGVLLALHPHLARSIFLPGVLTLLLLAYIAIRARHALLEELARSRHAEQISRSESLFLTLVGHELTTPLQSLLFSISALSRQAPSLPPDSQKRIDTVARASQRLFDLIQSLIDFTRIDARRLEISPESIDLRQLAEQVLSNIESSSARKADAVQLSLSMENDLPEVVTDRQLLRIALTQLLTNALKYTDQGTIELRLYCDARGHHIAVADTGSGVPRNRWQRIFEPFSPVEQLPSKHLPGMGLGLAMVKAIVTALSAELTMNSEVNVGTSIEIILPATPKERLS